MLRQFTAYLKTIGMTSIAKQCESDSEAEYACTERYCRTIYQRLIQEPDLPEAICQLVGGLIFLLRSSEPTKCDRKKSVNSNIHTETSCNNISYRSSDSVQRRGLASRSMSKQKIDRTNTSRSSSKDSNLYVKSLRLQEKKILNQRVKEQNEMSQCTFKPKVNTRQLSQRDKVNTPVFDRLAQQAQNKRYKTKMSQQLKEQSMMKECTFQPAIINNKENLQNSKSLVRNSLGAFERLYQDAVHKNKAIQRCESPKQAIAGIKTVESEIKCSQIPDVLNTTLMERLNRINLQMDTVMQKQKITPFRQNEYCEEEHSQILNVNPAVHQQLKQIQSKGASLASITRPHLLNDKWF